MDTSVNEQRAAAFVPRIPGRVALSRGNEPVLLPGRRPEIMYRNLFVADATGGNMRCEVMHVSPGDPARPTGWHYHTADLQFLYILQGWVDMEVDGIGPIRLNEHDSLLIPGGTIHQELRSSEHMRLLEVSVPSALGTVNCEPPTAS